MREGIPDVCNPHRVYNLVVEDTCSRQKGARHGIFTQWIWSIYG